MWCANCQADVAAEVTADNHGIRCAMCGTEISRSLPSRSSLKTREARQLLERWSNSELLDAFGPSLPSKSANDAEPPKKNAPAHDAEPAEVAETQRAQPPKPKFIQRFDTQHSTPDPAPAAEEFVSEAAATLAPANESAANTVSNSLPRIHASHEATAPRPHFDVQAAIEHDDRRKGAFASLIGQLIAYTGVGMLTIGTAMVLWGYFGGPESYAPTGWLITTAGQMLLFLGVVTLISGGMEQTTDEVTRQMETLGEKILRIEQVSGNHALRGPSIPASRFAENADQMQSSVATGERQA